ncbi:MAG: hypothetical protein ABEK59_10170 [Halobacteria archaeon]
MNDDVLNYLEDNSSSDKQDIMEQGLSLVDVLEDEEDKKRVLKKIERDFGRASE